MSLKTYMIQPGPGETRLCIEPWSSVFIKANGDVRLCCYDSYVGSIMYRTLSEILNGDEAEEYRTALLSGNLKNVCKYCGDKRVVSIDELRSAVNNWQEKGVVCE